MGKPGFHGIIGAEAFGRTKGAPNAIPRSSEVIAGLRSRIVTLDTRLAKLRGKAERSGDTATAAALGETQRLLHSVDATQLQRDPAAAGRTLTHLERLATESNKVAAPTATYMQQLAQSLLDLPGATQPAATPAATWGRSDDRYTQPPRHRGFERF